MDNLLLNFFIGLIFLIMGAFALSFGWKALKKEREAARWPSAPGIVISSELESYMDTDSEGDLLTFYRPKITYQYEVEGDVYTCNTVKTTPFGSSNLPKGPEKKLAAYPVGKQVVVHYDPTDPSNALMEFKTGVLMLVMIFGALNILIFLYLGVLAAIAVIG